MNPNKSTQEVAKLTTHAAKPSRRTIDPILQEVYDVKAKLNAEAGYSVQKIFERAQQNSALLAVKR